MIILKGNGRQISSALSLREKALDLIDSGLKKSPKSRDLNYCRFIVRNVIDSSSFYIKNGHNIRRKKYKTFISNVLKYNDMKDIYKLGQNLTEFNEEYFLHMMKKERTKSCLVDEIIDRYKKSKKYQGENYSYPNLNRLLDSYVWILNLENMPGEPGEEELEEIKDLYLMKYEINKNNDFGFNLDYWVKDEEFNWMI